jgi:hypothetical protein
MNDNEDDLSLPPDTLAILKQFLSEKQERENAECEKENPKFEENWASKFVVVMLFTLDYKNCFIVWQNFIPR